MSGPPRRKSVPPAPPPSFDDERPTPIASEAAARTTTTTQMELAPEPPTILAISITAPTFKSSDQVPAARLPSFAEAALTGPFAKTHVREGEGRTAQGQHRCDRPTCKYFLHGKTPCTCSVAARGSMESSKGLSLFGHTGDKSNSAPSKGEACAGDTGGPGKD